MSGKAGRPRTITKEAVDKIVQGTLDCLAFEAACGSAGCQRMTVSNWLADGEELAKAGRDLTEQEALCVQLVGRMADARAKAQADLINAIKDASKGGMRGDWRAAAFILERRWPRDWSQKTIDAVDEELNRALEILKDGLTKEEWTRVRRLLTRAARER